MWHLPNSAPCGVGALEGLVVKGFFMVFGLVLTNSAQVSLRLIWSYFSIEKNIFGEVSGGFP